MKPIRVLIVDDHVLLRYALRRLLIPKPALQIVGEAGDGQEAICLVKILLPDLILMDIVMPPEDGIKAIAAIKRDYPQIKIIAMTTFLDSIKIREALVAGADGCLLKDGDGEMFLQAIQTVQRGGKILHPRFVQQLSRNR